MEGVEPTCQGVRCIPKKLDLVPGEQATCLLCGRKLPDAMIKVNTWMHAAYAGSNVRRWHTEPSMGDQSVRSHSWGVAVIAGVLWRGSYGGHVPSALLWACLMHDLAEHWTSDVCGPQKWAEPELTALLRQREEAIEKMLGFDVALMEHEKLCLKLADKLEMLWWCFERRRDHGSRRTELVWSRVKGWLHQHYRGDQALWRTAWLMYTNLSRDFDKLLDGVRYDPELHDVT